MANTDEEQKGYEELETETTRRLEQEQVEQEIQAQEEEGLLAEAQEEEVEANELQQARVIEISANQAEAEQILETGLSFGRPSMIKWYIIFVLAGLNDVIDLLDLTGVLAILSWTVSLGLTASIIGILWFSDTKVKRANKFITDLNQPQIDQTGRAGLRTELSRKWTGGSESLAQKRQFLRDNPEKMSIGSNVSRVLKGGNPMTSTLIGSAIETIPYVDLLNLVIVWAIVAFLQERRVFVNARKAAEERYEQLLANSA